MFISRKNNTGFTLIEILVVIMIFGVFMGAVYSLYIAHLKTAFNRDEMLEVQQNVRIAMDRMTKDIRMAGFLVSSDSLAIISPAVEKTFSSYSTIRILTASAEATFGSISNVTQDEKFSVTPASVLNNFISGVDRVTIVRPSTRIPNGGSVPQVFNILSSSSGSGKMVISPPAPSDSLRAGDMVCKATKYPDTIEYRIDRTNECEKLPCLKRNSEIVAQGIKSIQFDYFINGANDVPRHDTSVMTDDDFRKITAVRVTIIGMTSKTILTVVPLAPENSRSLTTLIKLRNYK